MDDAVRLSADRFREVYEESFKVWSGLYLSTAQNPSLPASCLLIQDTFLQHPSFPRDLQLKHTRFATHTHSQLYATGSLVWGSAQADCRHGLPSFHRQVEIPVAVGSPFCYPSMIPGTPDPGFLCASWFARQDQNYLSILVLAWPYVLSARWIGLMPGRCSLEYTGSQVGSHGEEDAGDERPCAALDIGDATPEEARWWVAILAPAQGWQATITLEGTTFWSPWSVRLESGPRFSGAITCLSAPRTAAAPSFLEALRLLDSFCIRHNAMDQSHPALAAVLLLPLMEGQRLQLPFLNLTRTRNKAQSALATRPSLPCCTRG